MNVRRPSCAWFAFTVLLITALSTTGIRAVTDGPADANKNAQDDARKRLGNTKYWYGRIVMTINGSGHRYTPGEKATSRYSVKREVTINFRLSPLEGELAAVSSADELMKKMGNNPMIAEQLGKMTSNRHWMTPFTNAKPEDESDVKLEVNDWSDMTGMEAVEGGGKMESNYHFKRGSDARKVNLVHQLAINFEKGTYDLTLDGKSDLLNISEGVGGSAAAEKTTTKEGRVINTDLRMMNQKLPSDGSVISGSKAIPRSDLNSVKMQSFGSVHGRISWTLSPTPLDDVELVLKPDDYTNWLPRGGKDEQTEGNTEKITALLRKRGGGSTDVKIKHISITFSDVSTEPGVCLNVPLTKGAMTPDLAFAPEHNSGSAVKDKGKVLTKDGEFSQLPFVVSCYDWGAWGTVVAQADLNDGRIVSATLDGDPSTEGCRIPKREEDSKIADKWKDDMGISGVMDDTDNDKQKGNANDGDGLSNYEEYRGLIAQGKHTRDHSAGPDGLKPLTPTHKDLIVRNTVKKNADIQAGFTLFEKSSGIHIVELGDGELPDSRQVNLNAGPITRGPQYGLVVYDEPSKTAEGVTTPTLTARFEPKPSSPKGFEKVSVDLAGMRAGYSALVSAMKQEHHTVPFTVQEAIANTVAHELAHGIGVNHHGGDAYGSTYKQVTEKMKDWTIYDRDGKLITDRPFDIAGGQANPGNESSGDVDCIMCYNSTYNWSYHDNERTFYAVPIIAPGKIFCTDAKGTGTNAPRTMADGKAVKGLFGDASKGNCLSQMKVRDQ